MSRQHLKEFLPEHEVWYIVLVLDGSHDYEPNKLVEQDNSQLIEPSYMEIWRELWPTSLGTLSIALLTWPMWTLE